MTAHALRIRAARDAVPRKQRDRPEAASRSSEETWAVPSRTSPRP
jgi:hypothetical protein